MAKSKKHLVGFSACRAGIKQDLCDKPLNSYANGLETGNFLSAHRDRLRTPSLDFHRTYSVLFTSEPEFTTYWLYGVPDFERGRLLVTEHPMYPDTRATATPYAEMMSSPWTLHALGAVDECHAFAYTDPCPARIEDGKLYAKMVCAQYLPSIAWWQHHGDKVREAATFVGLPVEVLFVDLACAQAELYLVKHLNASPSLYRFDVAVDF